MGLFSWLFGMPRQSKANMRIQIRASSRSEPDIDDDDYVPTWHYYDVPFGRAHRAPGMVTLGGATDVTVAGTRYRLAACSEFINAAVRTLKGGVALPRIELQRQPDNPGHPNSIMVLGVLPDGRRLQIGYIPTEVSSRIAEDWAPDMPISAELRRFGLHRTDEAVFFAINVLYPDAATRKRFRKVG